MLRSISFNDYSTHKPEEDMEVLVTYTNDTSIYIANYSVDDDEFYHNDEEMNKTDLFWFENDEIVVQQFLG